MRIVSLLLFCVSCLGLSWLGMMAVHELGHVIGAMLTGGQVQQVVLHPFEISRTDVSPNPAPGIVVWLGPLFGAFVPVAIWLAIPANWSWQRSLAQWMAGFCLIANGCYIGFGSFARIGDCRQMLESGSPIWTLWLFACVTIVPGVWLWHRLGSLDQLWKTEHPISLRAAAITFATFVASAIVLALLSS